MLSGQFTKLPISESYCQYGPSPCHHHLLKGQRPFSMVASPIRIAPPATKNVPPGPAMAWVIAVTPMPRTHRPTPISTVHSPRPFLVAAYGFESLLAPFHQFGISCFNLFDEPSTHNGENAVVILSFLPHVIFGCASSQMFTHEIVGIKDSHWETPSIRCCTDS